MDKKKVTRRVAIGSAVGGLAAAPFIIRALKARCEVAVPLGNYEREWESYVKMLDVPINEIDGPATFTLDYRPQTGEPFRMVSLNASYDEHSYPSKYPQAPSCYTVTNGQVASTSPIIDARPALSISAGQHVTRSRNHSKEEPGGECVLVPTDDGGDYFVIRDDKPEPVKEAELGFARAAIAKSLTFNYPRGKSLATAMSWTIPETWALGFVVPCEVSRFAQVAGRKTVEVLAARDLSNEEVQQSIIRRMPELTQMMSEVQGPRFDATRAVKDCLKQAIEDERTQALHVTAYLDLKTGLVVRQKHTLTTHYPKARRRDQTHIDIVQVLEG